MPPRYAYWTILVDDQPTAFRAAMQEDLMPTFKRLKEKHPSATMMWFQNGKLWPTRVDAQEAMRARGELGRRGDERQGAARDRRPVDRRERPDWKPRPSGSRERPPIQSEKLDWKPKGSFAPPPPRSEKPEWKPRSAGTPDRRPPRAAKPDWTPKGSFARDRKPEWKPKGSFDRDRKPEWKPRSARPQDRKPASPKLEWQPKSGSPQSRKPAGVPEKRKWIPKEEYKKSRGIETPRDSKWRPGGEHKDPRQKYKDAKKAKWTRFKKTIRTRWESKKKT